MLSPQLREQIALKKFSLISPVINGQVENIQEYFGQLCAQPIEMPHYGARRYSPKTLRNWLVEYRRHVFDALKPCSIFGCVLLYSKGFAGRFYGRFFEENAT